MQRFAPLIGRILLAAIFLLSGFNKITGFEGGRQYMESYGMPMTSLLLAGAIVLELFGAISLILGWKTRWGALALILFLIPATLIFHTNFPDEQIMFMKNIAILGGLLMVWTFGPGPLSVDKR